MIRTLLATTALSALLATGAIAQDAAPAAPAATEAPATPATPAAPAAPAEPVTSTDMAPAADIDASAMETTDVMEPWDMSAGYNAADTDNLGTRLIGQPVFSTAGDDAEEIGTISDLVFNEDGQIMAVVIGVGGFLGLGEKAVAVDFQALEFTVAADNTERWVLPTTVEALTAAPEFVWEEDEPVDGASDPMAPAAPATN